MGQCNDDICILGFAKGLKNLRGYAKVVSLGPVVCGSQIGPVCEVQQGKPYAFPAYEERMVVFSGLLVFSNPCKHDPFLFFQPPVYLHGSGRTLAAFIKNMVVCGKEYIDAASCKIVSIAVRSRKAWITCIWLSGKSEFHVCNCNVSALYQAVDMHEICAEII